MRLSIRCWWTLLALVSLPAAARSEDWPQWMGPQRDGIWRETGILLSFPKDGPKVKWRVPLAYGYAGPAVAAGRVYVTDYLTANDPSKGGILKGKERVRCLNEADGKELWKYEYDCEYRIDYPSGPRCTPTVSGGKVYALGAMGDLVCLDAVKGDKIWSRDLKKDYHTKAPWWGFAGHPLVDGQRLFCLVGGQGSVAVAFDKDTGKELWKALSVNSDPGYSSPTLIEAGGKRQLIFWTADALNGLDPATGTVYWTVPLAPNFGMAIMSPRKSGDYLFAGGIAKSALLKLAGDRPAAELVWYGKKNQSLYAVNSTPLIEDGYLYGVDQSSALCCVKLDTGERLWATLDPTGGKEATGNYRTAFLVKNGDRWFLFSETGELIIAKLSPKGYQEVSRWRMLEPTSSAFGRQVVWSHPAFANRCVFARNDKELVCASLAE